MNPSIRFRDALAAGFKNVVSLPRLWLILPLYLALRTVGFAEVQANGAGRALPDALIALAVFTASVFFIAAAFRMAALKRAKGWKGLGLGGVALGKPEFYAVAVPAVTALVAGVLGLAIAVTGTGVVGVLKAVGMPMRDEVGALTPTAFFVGAPAALLVGGLYFYFLVRTSAGVAASIVKNAFTLGLDAGAGRFWMLAGGFLIAAVFFVVANALGPDTDPFKAPVAWLDATGRPVLDALVRPFLSALIGAIGVAFSAGFTVAVVAQDTPETKPRPLVLDGA